MPTNYIIGSSGTQLFLNNRIWNSNYYTITNSQYEYNKLFNYIFKNEFDILKKEKTSLEKEIDNLNDIGKNWR